MNEACMPSHLQLCMILWDPVDGSPPGSSVHGILQARILKWVAISYSRGSSQPRGQICISYVCISSLAGGFFTTSCTWETFPVGGKGLINFLLTEDTFSSSNVHWRGGGQCHMRRQKRASSHSFAHEGEVAASGLSSVRAFTLVVSRWHQWCATSPSQCTAKFWSLRKLHSCFPTAGLCAVTVSCVWFLLSWMGHAKL